MKLLFTVFIDALKPESLACMPFLNSLGFKRRMRTELGYSLTCKASIFSGVHPNKHHVWFVGQYSPETSPFKWIKRTGVDRLPHNKYTRAAIYMMTKIVSRNKRMDYWGLFREPMKNWPYFDAAGGEQPIFDILHANGVRCKTSASEILSNRPKAFGPGEERVWIYLFIGDIDPLTHRYGQDSPEVVRRLKEIDGQLAKAYALIQQESGEKSFVCFSDHGQSKVEGKIDLKSHFRSCGKSLDDYIHFVETNYARFWFNNDEKRKQEVLQVFSALGDKGFVLTEQHLKRYHVDMPDNRYGDLIYYLNYPLVFDLEGLTLLGREMACYANYMHGFTPDLPGSDGVFITDKEIVADSHVELVDIFPSILDFFDVPVPGYVDGRVLWKANP